MGYPAPLRALEYRNFRLFFIGQLISLVGTWMQTVAQAWLVYRLTGSSVLLGAIGFTSQVPIFVLAPLAGIAADRFPRRTVVIAAQAAMMIQASILAVLTLSGKITVPELFVLAGALGVASAFDFPARYSLFAELVERQHLINAVALNSSLMTAAAVVGPSIAGVLVATIGEGWCFAANAVSYFAVLTALIMMQMPPRARVHRDSPLQHLVEGFRYVARTPAIYTPLVLLGIFSLIAYPYQVLMPIFADRILHGGAAALGWLMACSGVGATAGSLTLAAQSRYEHLARWMAAAAGGGGLMLVLFSSSRVFWLSALLLIPLGFCASNVMGAANTYIQSIVPDRLRGRVMSCHSMMFLGMVPFGSLLAGAVANQVGAPWTVAGGGALAVLAAGLFAVFLPRVEANAGTLKDPDAAEQQQVGA